MSINSNDLDDYVLLTEVPSKYYEKPQISSKPIRWHVQYNVAAWLRFSKPLTQAISLVVTYQDSARLKEAEVEVYAGNETNMLLSGIATLMAVGPITNMTIELKGVDEDVSVKIDELYIQKVQKQDASGNNDNQEMRFTLRA